jgi:hypothetical protein
VLPEASNEEGWITGGMSPLSTPVISVAELVNGFLASMQDSGVSSNYTGDLVVMEVKFLQLREPSRDSNRRAGCYSVNN